VTAPRRAAGSPASDLGLAGLVAPPSCSCSLAGRLTHPWRQDRRSSGTPTSAQPPPSKPGPFLTIHPEATRRWLAFTSPWRWRWQRRLAPGCIARPARDDALATGRKLHRGLGLAARLAFRNSPTGGACPPSRLSPLRQQEPLAGCRACSARRYLATGLAEEACRDRVGRLDESRRAGRGQPLGGTASCWPAGLSRGGVLANGWARGFVLLRLWARGSSRLSPRGMLAAIALLALAAIAVASLLPTEARDRVISLGAVTSEASGSYRLAVWRDTRRLIASSPLVGSGFGAYADALRRFRTAAGEVDVSTPMTSRGRRGGGVVGALASRLPRPCLLRSRRPSRNASSAQLPRVPCRRPGPRRPAVHFNSPAVERALAALPQCCSRTSSPGTGVWRGSLAAVLASLAHLRRPGIRCP
jgi:hypothetical protein